MQDLGVAKQILGMRITRDREVLKLLQEEYVKKVLSRFNMVGAKPVISYASTIGSLMYVMACTRSKIAYAVGVVNRYMSNPGKQHWEEVKWILRYLRGTAGRKSTIRYVYTLGGTAVNWISKLQKIVTLSTIEAKTKHIQVRYHFIRLALEDGVLTLDKIQGNRNPIDMLTKTAMIEKLKLRATSIGLFN
ncbi:Retrovirus-related Pol polyprotein from transposon TNT 1-94 [Vitis vinifera]|uniref:Retrovirus-related Pol polyprotein from transposon TNT 1-94 n=1 Tax=Vitis vinifera TaxID=29760 RepID=A0A438FT04_VITVI|nr:Retrovirus-related Pol polyprotein from transposon TNT 1-94 [Vitis vinifera]